jgi:hypothetical protein
VRGRVIARVVLWSVLASLALASPASAASKTLVSYEQSGGIAGIQTGLSVTVGGSARLTSSRVPGITRFKLTVAQLRGLKRDLRDARFSTLRSLYESKDPVADGISQTVRYAGHRVTVSTGGRPPARLRKVLMRLSGLASRLA